MTPEATKYARETADGYRWRIAGSLIMIGTMPDELLQNMLELAKRLAREAADIAQAGLGCSNVRRKADNSLVTETDHAIQAHVLKAIALRYPDHAVCAEETVEATNHDRDPATSRYCWIVDPLDGTRNFAAGFPCYAISIAVLDNGRPIVAVVREHPSGLLYAAIDGDGTTQNGKPIRCAARSNETDLLIGIPSSKDSRSLQITQRWAATHGLILRNLGSTAFHLALVASGALAGAFCRRCKIWDVAAGALLITQAGGRITSPTGTDLVPFNLNANPEDDVPFLAAAPDVHQRLRKSIEECSEDVDRQNTEPRP